MLTRPALWALGIALTPFTSPMDRGLSHHRAPASPAWRVSGPGAAAACARMPDGLVSWWRGDGDALDFTGTNPGTLQGNIGFAAGMVGQAFNLAGGFVVVPDNATLDLTGEFAFEFWYQHTLSYNDFRGLLAKRVGGTNGVTNYGASLETLQYGLGLYYNDPAATGGDDFTKLNSQFESIRLFPAPNAGAFHHFAGTYRQLADGIELTLYVDGALARSDNIPGNLANTVNNAALTIGASAAGLEPFLGLIDEVAIYSRALSEDEIAAIHRAGSAGKCTVVPFANFQITRARIGQSRGATQDQIDLWGQFALGPSSDGIALPGEQVAVTLGGLTWTISGSSFVRTDENDGFQYHTTAPGLKQVVIRDNGMFRVRASELDLGMVGAASPLAFTLRIGNDEGSANVASAERGSIR